jgi:DNA repair exonuclease SbcCD nuclease subunit
MKVLALGDSHFFEAGSRFEECVRVHDWIADLVHERKPDLVCHTGDIYERASTPRERLAVSAFFRRVAEVCPVLIVRGNHDALHDVELLGRIEAEHNIRVVETAEVIPPWEFEPFDSDLWIGCVAWPSNASALDENSAREHLASVLRGQGEQMRGAKKRLLIGHFMVDGCVTSLGQPMIGGALNVPLSDFSLAGAQAVVCGHIHKPQDWVHDGVPILYTGSPYRTAFGETEEKSVVLLEWDAENRVTWERIATPARAMHLATARYEDTVLGHVFRMEGTWPVSPDIAGADIRLRYECTAERKDEARKEANAIRDIWLAGGAHSVKIEAVVTTTVRARAPEVAQAKSLPDKLDAMWESTGEIPSTERRGRLLGKLSQLESEASA